MRLWIMRAAQAGDPGKIGIVLVPRGVDALVLDGDMIAASDGFLEGLLAREVRVSVCGHWRSLYALSVRVGGESQALIPIAPL
jgi:hypothetical protein